MGPSHLLKAEEPSGRDPEGSPGSPAARVLEGIILAVPVGIDGSVRASAQAMVLKRVSVSVQMDPSGFGT